MDVSPLSLPQGQQSLRALRSALAIPLYCLTLFCSSSLLFLSEPMFAKMVLPLLGGTPAVWNTCMVSFQILLLAAYSYGHWSIGWFGIQRQARLQLFLLIAIALALPIAIPTGSHPPAGRNPIFWLLTVLPLSVGFPFFAVASTAPVLQRWFATTGHRAGKDPYFLYAASNIGSMIALLAYPSLFEPVLRLVDQSRLWTAGYLILIVLVGCCSLLIGPEQQIHPAFAIEHIPVRRRVRWILLAMIPSSLLLGSTTFITTDIAAVPLLWIVPLALYLLSFILVFSSRPIVSHRLMVRLQPVVVLGVGLFMLGRVAQPVWMVLLLHLAALFVSSMVCHGELAANRPSVSRLTDFYLTMSLGGVLGGLFNALLAPVLFHSALEYPIALLAACAICPQLRFRSTGKRRSLLSDLITPAIVAVLALALPRLLESLWHRQSITLQMVGLGLAVMMAATAIHRRRRLLITLATLFAIVSMNAANGELLAIRRSFFGIHRIVHSSNGSFNDLYHGTTVHGRQRANADDQPCDPTTALTYYHQTGPIGQLLLQRLSDNQNTHLGVVGMGVGSLAAYAGPHTQLTYYEIDPVVRWVAQDSGYFSFLTAARKRGAQVNIIMGDARLTLDQTAARSYDTLVLDAFCGDAIPVHLLTREAMHIYTEKLTQNGVLAIHISNMYLNLLPICAALVQDAGCVGLYQDDLEISPEQAAEGKTASQWVIVGKSASALAAQKSDPRWKPLPRVGTDQVWTDDFSNILSVFRWQ